MAPKETNLLGDSEIAELRGSLVCDSPNEFMDKWDGNVTTKIA